MFEMAASLNEVGSPCRKTVTKSLNTRSPTNNKLSSTLANQSMMQSASVYLQV